MRVLIAYFVLLLGAAGCSLFGNDGDPLPYRLVSQTPTDSLSSGTVLSAFIQSADMAQEYRETYSISRTELPDVDWSRETLYVTMHTLKPDERYFVERVALRGGREVVLEAVIRRGTGVEGDRRRVVVAVAITGAPRPITASSTTVRYEGGTGTR